MTTPDMLSINNVAAKLGLSVHQLRRWELMFGLEIKRGRGQQRQYRDEDLSVLERIKELVEQGWPTSQIRPQLEAEGLVSPKLIGVTPSPGNPEVLQESIIGLRNFTERRFIEISKQIDELRQLLISVTLKNELSADKASPWQPTASEYMPAPKIQPPQEITIGPQISIDPPNSNMYGNSGNAGLIGRPQPGPSLQRQEPRTSFEPSTSSEAVSRSMSALDSMFKEREARDSESTQTESSGFTKVPVIPPPDSQDSPSALAANSSITPVRHSTIPPLPTPLPIPALPITESAVAGLEEQGSAENLQTDASSIQAVETAQTVAQSVPDTAQYTATSVDFPALNEAAISEADVNTSSSEDLQSADSALSKFTAASTFSVPPLPPNPFKTSTESTEAAQANLRSLFSPATPEPTLGLNTGFAPGSFAPTSTPSLQDLPTVQTTPQAASAYEPNATPAPGPDSSQEDTAEELMDSADNFFNDDQDQAEAPQPAPEEPNQPIQLTPGPQVNFGPNVSAAAPTPQATPQRVDDNFGLGEVTDQNYLTVLGRALDLIGWTDEQADSYSLKTFGVPHWDELGRSQAEKLVAHLIGLLKEQVG
ncbi:MerR family transcriptional regulator [bacterium]|nr:MerR family transcriptional regulator [bacterium]